MKQKILLCALALSFLPAQAAIVGQVDTFEDGTLMGWHVGPDPGNPNPPQNVATGGPAGAGDNYLQLTASGRGGPGSKLSVLSGDQWAGNYIAEGINQIRMDVRNFGPDDLYLRLLFEDEQAPGPPLHLALSKNYVFVPAGSDWMTVHFGVTPDDLLPGIFGNVTGALANADTVRIFHNFAAAFPGPPNGQPSVNATLGVDNITAVVPEPATTGFAVAGLMALACLKKFRVRAPR